MAFTHLHVHSEYSLLDGLARVPDLVQTARELGFESLALTDHGAMYGSVRFYQEAVEAGIKPIIGCELYVARRGRRDRDSSLDRGSYHLTVLAANDRGYRNLLALASKAQLEGFYYKPRVDRELLEQHRDGLVVMSGCAQGEVPRRIRDGQLDEARAALAWHKEVFGDRFYIELMSHDLDFLPDLNRQLVSMAREMDVPMVVTNDVHYARPEDHHTHEVLLCLQTSTTMVDPKRMQLGSKTFYLRSEPEMRALFPELPEAAENTNAIAEMCNVELVFNEYKLPRFDVPDGKTAERYLRELCDAGIQKRYQAVTPEVEARLDDELRIIHGMGFDDYFLIVWDICRYAREKGIWWNVRGSGAGSIVAYALGITNIDPLAHDLIFERFLNPSRVSMPDIDLDFPDDQRDELIKYTFRKYGHDHVAQIITFGTMGARAAIRDAGRALDLPFELVDSVARVIPAIPGKPCSIDDVLARPADGEERSGEFFRPELATMYEDDGDVQQLLDTARGLEGVTRHASTHAAGVVISDRPLVEYVPLSRPLSENRTFVTDEGETTLLPVTQYAMNDIEKLGLLKVDFLGLSTLTVLRKAAHLIEKYHGKTYTLDNIPLDDPSIYELLSSGDVTGVFQVESAGMRRMLREMRPQRFENVVAAVALYRPGPMDYIPDYIQRMHGDQPISYRHESLEPILAETYGICVYQEQIIRIARDLAGYNAGEADTIRKAVGKKIKAKLLEHRSKFVSGAVANGIPEETSSAIFDDIETFARYGFNKAHAADYAVIVCQTAYFKANYPVEYMAALLSVDRDDTDKIAIVAADCRRMGIELLPPDVCHSETEFTIENIDENTEGRGDTEGRGTPSGGHKGAIRFGLAAVKNVGQGPAESIVAGRGDEPFANLDDFCRRVDLRHVGKRALESLVKAGAFDSLGPRAPILASIDRMVAYSSSHHEAMDVGQMSLFGDMVPAETASMLYPLPRVTGDVRSELEWEKELIGLYLSSHPLARVADDIAKTVTTFIGDIDDSMDKTPVTIAGMVAAVREITTKKEQRMAFVRVEDLGGAIELIVFPSVFQSTAGIWRKDNVVVVHGRVEKREQRLQIIVNTAELYDPDGSGEQEAEAAAFEPELEPWEVAPLDVGTHEVATSEALHKPAATEPQPAEPTGAESQSAEAGTGQAALKELKSQAQRAETAPNEAPHPEREVGEARRSEAAHGEAGRGGAVRGRPAPSQAARASVRPQETTPASAPVPETPKTAQYLLLVTLPRDSSKDSEETIRLLSQVYQALESFDGADEFRIYLPNGSETVELEFPNTRTRYCVSLMKTLGKLLGDDSVDVQPMGG
jgi:DNA polymerase-3 subunit alpha